MARTQGRKRIHQREAPRNRTKSSAAKCFRVIQKGEHEDVGSGNDNTRIKRFIAKYTINPARMFGVDKYVGSLEPGKIADIVFWKPGLFGMKRVLWNFEKALVNSQGEVVGRWRSITKPESLEETILQEIEKAKKNSTASATTESAPAATDSAAPAQPESEPKLA